jgi:hypothetical protein
LRDVDDQVSELEESCDLVRLKVHHLNEIFKIKITTISIASIRTENVKYLRFRVFQKNSSFFKIIHNPTYSGHFIFPSHQMTFCLFKIYLFFTGNFSVWHVLNGSVVYFIYILFLIILLSCYFTSCKQQCFLRRRFFCRLCQK